MRQQQQRFLHHVTSHRSRIQSELAVYSGNNPRLQLVGKQQINVYNYFVRPFSQQQQQPPKPASALPSPTSSDPQRTLTTGIFSALKQEEQQQQQQQQQQTKNNKKQGTTTSTTGSNENHTEINNNGDRNSKQAKKSIKTQGKKKDTREQRMGIMGEQSLAKSSSSPGILGTLPHSGTIEGSGESNIRKGYEDQIRTNDSPMRSHLRRKTSSERSQTEKDDDARRRQAEGNLFTEVRKDEQTNKKTPRPRSRRSQQQQQQRQVADRSLHHHTNFSFAIYNDVKHRKMYRAEQMLNEFKRLKLENHPDVADQTIQEKSLVHMMERYGEMKEVKKAEALLQSLEKPPFNMKPNLYILGGMISCYGNAGELDEMLDMYAHIKSLGLFSFVEHRDLLHTFNLLLRGLLNAFKVTSETHRGPYDHRVDKDDFKEKLSAILFEMRRSKVRPNIYTYNRLLDIAAKLNDLPMLTAIFDELVSMGPKPSQDHSSGNQDGEAEMSTEIDSMATDSGTAITDESDNIIGDDDSGSAEQKKANIDYDEEPPVPDVYTFTIMVQALCQRGENRVAEKYLRIMTQEYKIRPNKFTWQPIIDFYCKNGQPQQALDLFQKMAQEIKPDYYFFTSLISGFGLVGDTEMALQVFNMAKDTFHIQTNEVLYTTIINVFSSLNDSENTHKYLNEMLERGLTPNTYTVSALITLYTRHQMGEKAMEMIHMMRRHQATVSNITYEAVMTYMAKKEKYDELDQLLDMMVEDYEHLVKQRTTTRSMHSKLQPRISAFNMLMFKFLAVDMPKRTIAVYERLVRLMKFADYIAPDHITGRTLIEAHSRIGEKQAVLDLYKTHFGDKKLLPDTFVLLALVDNCISKDHFDAIVDLFAFLSHVQRAILRVSFLGDTHRHRVPKGYGPRHIIFMSDLERMIQLCQSLLDSGCDKYEISRESVEALMMSIESVTEIHLQLQQRTGKSSLARPTVSDFNEEGEEEEENI